VLPRIIHYSFLFVVLEDVFGLKLKVLPIFVFSAVILANSYIRGYNPPIPHFSPNVLSTYIQVDSRPDFNLTLLFNEVSEHDPRANAQTNLVIESITART
jgi:hypothetical protein